MLVLLAADVSSGTTPEEFQPRTLAPQRTDLGTRFASAKSQGAAAQREEGLKDEARRALAAEAYYRNADAIPLETPLAEAAEVAEAAKAAEQDVAIADEVFKGSRISGASLDYPCSQGGGQPYEDTGYAVVKTRGDGIGSQLLDRVIKLAVAHKIGTQMGIQTGFLPDWPVWERRAGTKDCFPELCRSHLNDRLYPLVQGQAGRWHRVEEGGMQFPRWLPSDDSTAPNVTLCDLPTNGVAIWARGTRELGQDVASYVGRYFSSVMGSEMPVARQSHACVHQRFLRDRTESCQEARYAEALAEDLHEARWDRWLRVGSDQCPFTDDELNLTSAGLRRRYPGLRRILVACDYGTEETTRRNPAVSKALHDKALLMGFDEVRCQVQSTPESEPVGDLDAEYMARECSVVVAARSTYSLMAVVLGLGMDMAKTTEPSMTPWNPWQNATYYSPKWSGAIAAGLFTAYDLSGVSDVRVLWNGTGSR